MKKIALILSVCFIVIGSLSSCEKDDPNNSGNNNNNNNTPNNFYLSALIDADSFYVDTTNFQDYFSFDKYTAGNTWLTVRRQNIDIAILIDTTYHGVGSYTLSTDLYPGPMAFVDFGSSSSDYYSTDGTHTGTLTITYDANEIVAGTFNFTGRANDLSGNTKQVTNGQFKLPVRHL